MLDAANLEAVVPPDHPLRGIARILDEVLDGEAAATKVVAAAVAPDLAARPVVALRLLSLLYGLRDIALVVPMLRYDLAMRWFADPAASLDLKTSGSLHRLAEQAIRLPAMRHLVGTILANPHVAELARDVRLRPNHTAIAAAVREGRRAARRRRGRLWIQVAAALLILLVVAPVVYAGWALPTADELRALLGRPSLVVDIGADHPDRGRAIVAVPVDRAALPQAFVDVLLTAEDRRFYWHPGFDPIGMARAMLAAIQGNLGGEGGAVQGGSTLTQQLAKNAFLNPARTLRRKLDEMLLAIRLELMFSKDELLELYLANAYFGDGVNGIELAARDYFGKRAAELDLAEAALLVQLLPAPERRRPDLHWPMARERALALLGMVQSEHPEHATAIALARQRLTAASLAALGRGRRDFRRVELRWFRDWVLGELPALFPDAAGEHRLVLTLEPLAQIYAQIAIERLVQQGRNLGYAEAAVVVMRPNGRVVALVGGRSYAASQFSRATAARRQPGSAFKPVVYLAALEAGWTPGRRVSDRPYGADGWPRNYRGGHQGEVSMLQAFRQSLNGAAVQLAEAVGRPQIVATARRLGLEGPFPDKPSLALGVAEVTLLELTAAYAVFANGGVLARPTGVVALRDDTGRPVAWPVERASPIVIQPEPARAMNQLLRSAVEPGGSGSLANIDRHVAGKTGTTQANRDAWFIGFTGDFVVGIWVGNDDGRPMKPEVTGGNVPARAFANLMANLREDLLGGRTTPPFGLGN